jgi:membrane fusion protein (multidrug efflux system)
VDPRTGAGVVRAHLAPQSGLKLGQFVRVRVMTGEHPGCLIVPATAVAKDPTGAAFVALVEDEKAILKPVKVGVRDGDLVEVEGEGLEEGRTIVTEGAYGLIMTQQFATRIRVVTE